MQNIDGINSTISKRFQRIEAQKNEIYKFSPSQTSNSTCRPLPRQSRDNKVYIETDLSSFILGIFGLNSCLTSQSHLFLFLIISALFSFVHFCAVNVFVRSDSLVIFTSSFVH